MYKTRLLSIDHIYFVMKDQNLLQDELTKLKEISNVKIDVSFVAGYLAFAIPFPFAKEIKPISFQLVNMVQQGLISHQNVLQIMTVIKINVIGRNPKHLMKEIQNSIEGYMNELALDNLYLQNKYFNKELEKVENISQSLGIECPICSVDIKSLQLCYLSCGHMYHSECLNAHCQVKISNKIIPIPCPSQDCKNELLQQQITQFLRAELRDKYDQFAFHNYVENHMDDTSWCPTPGCCAVFAFDQALTNYKCPACKKDYCLVCKCEFHNGFTCEEYKKVANLSQDDKQFMFLVKGSKYKQCPNCKFWVEKNEGCDHMTCRCKYQFCYVCGGKYNRCKCKGFVNEVQEPRLLEEVPFEKPKVPQPPIVPEPPILSNVVNSPPKSFERIQNLPPARSLFSFKSQREPRYPTRKPQNLLPPPQLKIKQQQQQEVMERLRLMEIKQKEQILKREQEQMQRAIKLSEEQSIQNMWNLEQEKPKPNIRMKQQIIINHPQESNKKASFEQKWKVRLNENEQFLFNKSWRHQIKQSKESVEYKKQAYFKDLYNPRKELQQKKSSYKKFFNQKGKQLKSSLFPKKKEELQRKSSLELLQIGPQFKLSSQNLFLKQQQKIEKKEQRQ